MNRVPAASRRDLVGVLSAMLMLGAIEAGPAKAAELDGALLLAYRAWLPFERQRAAEQALFDADENPEEEEARYAAFSNRWHDSLLVMIDMPARTPEGIAAKAHALRALLQNHVGGLGGIGLSEGATSSEQFAWSLVTDMLGKATA